MPFPVGESGNCRATINPIRSSTYPPREIVTILQQLGALSGMPHRGNDKIRFELFHKSNEASPKVSQFNWTIQSDSALWELNSQFGRFALRMPIGPRPIAPENWRPEPSYGSCVKTPVRRNICLPMGVFRVDATDMRP
ncbi:hypothetical protein [Chachezhania antarctica]|uniref:hypothetical protein n=1 Tax=Chachezhania antarctica TaxID=2340860 RepID=UPI0013CE6522|nr:hypothetical protein [Chachezhania antarctica]